MSRSFRSRLDRAAADLPATPRPPRRNPLDVLAERLDRSVFIAVLGLDVLDAADLDGLTGSEIADLRHRRPDVPPPPGCPPGASVATMLRVALSDDELRLLNIGFVVDRVRYPEL